MPGGKLGSHLETQLKAVPANPEVEFPDATPTYVAPRPQLTLPQLTLPAGGTVAGRGAENGRTFELRDGRVDGSRLNATKRFADGTTEALEGIFINRRRIEGRTAEEITSDHTTFGPGVTSVDFTFGGATFDRLFYERK